MAIDKLGLVARQELERIIVRLEVWQRRRGVRAPREVNEAVQKAKSELLRGTSGD